MFGTDLPLHAIISHLPLGIAFIAPLITLLSLDFYNKRMIQRWSFLVIVALQLILSGAAYIAMETGETQASKLENIVEQEEILAHQKKANIFFMGSLALLALAGALMFVPGRSMFSGGTTLLVLGQVTLVVFGYWVTVSGLELVYKHGAACVYQQTPENKLNP